MNCEEFLNVMFRSLADLFLHKKAQKPLHFKYKTEGKISEIAVFCELSQVILDHKNS